MTPAPRQIQTLAQLSAPAIEQVRSLLDAATSADGGAPVGEHVVLQLPAPAADRRRHFLLRSPLEDLAGYAFAEDGDDQAREIEFAIHPAHRRRGHGRALYDEAVDDLLDMAAGTRTVRAWAHGDHPAARALAHAVGARAVRTLLQLRRPLAGLEQLGDRKVPGGVTLRSFRPGEDDAQWLRVNARAFADHPEQGRMTQADLQARMDEPWFDPKGFLIAERDGAIAGFHWTKVHPEGLGEVYVVGVDPDQHGGGLGTALTLAGLQHLHERDLPTVLLYVESDNAAALAVYRRLGFTPWSTDVMYASSPRPPA